MQLDHCFCCNVEFDQSVVDGPKDWPGVIFDATGNWGSTIFDPSPSERPAVLRIRICDKCVIERQSRIEQTGDSMSKELRVDVKQFFTNRAK